MHIYLFHLLPLVPCLQDCTFSMYPHARACDVVNNQVLGSSESVRVCRDRAFANYVLSSTDELHHTNHLQALLVITLPAYLVYPLHPFNRLFDAHVDSVCCIQHTPYVGSMYAHSPPGTCTRPSRTYIHTPCCPTLCAQSADVAKRRHNVKYTAVWTPWCSLSTMTCDSALRHACAMSQASGPVHEGQDD